MVKQCAAPGCTHAAKSRYSRYCNSHRTRLRRHGDLRQEAVLASHLKPYLAVVERERQRSRDFGKGCAYWGLMTDRWRSLADHAATTIRAWESGAAMSRDDRLAAYELQRIGKDVSVATVIDTVLALYLLAEDQPRLFPTQRGLVFQLARRLRGLAEANCGIWHDSQTGKAKRVYRDVPPQVTERMGAMVVDVLGGGALSFARVLAQRAETERRAKVQLRQALDEMAEMAA